MPRAFTEEERREIETRIRTAAADLFRRLGFKKTTVADLASAAGISKGAFYLFYAAKEDVMLDLVADYEREMRAQMEAEFKGASDGGDALRRIVKAQVQAVREEPVLRDLVSGDLLQQVWRGASDRKRRESVESDEAFLAHLAAHHLPLSVSPAVAAGMLRAVVIVSLQREQIGEESADAVIEAMIDAVVSHIAKRGDS